MGTAWKTKHRGTISHDREYADLTNWRQTATGAKDLNDCQLEQEAHAVRTATQDKYLLGGNVDPVRFGHMAFFISAASVFTASLACVVLAVQRLRRQILASKSLMRTIVSTGGDHECEGAE